MISILFSPSEGKVQGGNNEKITLLGGIETRKKILDRYNSIILSQDDAAVKKLFGLKKTDDTLIYMVDIFNAPTLKAVQRYRGVAYEYLQYNTLDTEERNYIDRHTIIFSNLFEPVKADDRIPIYKVKQGNTIGEIKPEEFYKERFSYQLDLYLGTNEILDLRAGYYDKFYKTKRPYTTLKFLKNGKIVSHWAKAYRGIVLREMAKHNIQTLQDLKKMPIENLIIEEIRKQKNKTEIIYTIVD